MPTFRFYWDGEVEIIADSEEQAWEIFSEIDIDEHQCDYKCEEVDDE